MFNLIYTIMWNRNILKKFSILYFCLAEWIFETFISFRNLCNRSMWFITSTASSELLNRWLRIFIFILFFAIANNKKKYHFVLNQRFHTMTHQIYIFFLVQIIDSSDYRAFTSPCWRITQSITSYFLCSATIYSKKFLFYHTAEQCF